MTAENIIIVVLVLIVALLSAVLLFGYVRKRATAYLDERCDAMLKALVLRYKDDFAKFRDSTKAELHHSIENMLANVCEKTDNSGAPGPAVSPKPEQPPFWTNRDKLKAAEADLNRGEFDTDQPNLAGLTTLEAMRDVDRALADLDDENNQQ